MKTPPFLTGATLLFWGWQTGLWALAIPFALALEVARWLRAIRKIFVFTDAVG